MPQNTFDLENVKKIILDTIEDNTRFLFNELELQMLVARALEQEFKADDGYIVYLEYRLPKGWNKGFDDDYARWGETPYFDIVLEHVIPEDSPQFIGIELKYKLKEVKQKEREEEFKRFGMFGDSGIKLVSNQAAENEGRYDFWKDVKRLELLAKHFNDSVIGGIAIFLTNQGKYKNQKTDNKYHAFNLSEKKKDQLLNWDHQTQPDWCKCDEWTKGKCCNSCQEACGEDRKKEPAKRKDKEKVEWGAESSHFKRPNFSLEGDYTACWLNSWDGPLKQKFYCCYVTVQKK